MNTNIKFKKIGSFKTPAQAIKLVKDKPDCRYWAFRGKKSVVFEWSVNDKV